MSNLRGSLAQRGLLGASFANDQLAQMEAEFKLQEQLAIAQVYQQEFANTFQTLQAEQALKLEQTVRELKELEYATDFLSGVQQATTTQSKILAEMAGEQALRAQGFNPDEMDLTFPSTNVTTPSTGGKFTTAGIGTSDGAFSRTSDGAFRRGAFSGGTTTTTQNPREARGAGR